MKVLVLGTGRCGTATFLKACSHITNYRCVREPKYHFNFGSLEFPLETEQNSIIIDPHLTWLLPLLSSSAFLVHLKRTKADVVASWIKRGDHRGPGPWNRFVFSNTISFKDSCELCYDAMVGQIEAEFTSRENRGQNYMTLHLESIKTRWLAFWNTIKAEGDYKKSLAEWDRKYNASKTIS